MIAVTALTGGTIAHGVDVVGCEVDKVLASDADALDRYGEHIVARGDVAIVGAWNDEENVDKLPGFSFGSAYVLRRVSGAWLQEQKLMPSDPAVELRFGQDVAIDGDRAMASAVGADNYTGAVYFYDYDGDSWSNEQKLQPEEALAGDQVGTAIALDGDIAVAGAPGDNTVASGSGAAYIFRNVAGQWVQELKVIAADAAQFDFFGSAVAVAGDTVFIASRVDDDQGVSTGSVWVYRYIAGSWQEVQKLYASDAEFGELFGHSIAVGDGVLVIGAIHTDDACPDDDLCNSGAAYVFRFDGAQWVEEAKIIAADGEPDDEFGMAVAIEGDIVVVGTTNGDDACPEDPECESGVAYVFHHQAGTWSQAGKLRASDTEFRDFFGADVAVSGGDALVGCFADDDEANGAGSLYLFDAVNVGCCPADLNGNGTVDFGDLLVIIGAWGASGGPADLDGSGTVDFGDLLAAIGAWGPCTSSIE
jgi:hypothetical protein